MCALASVHQVLFASRTIDSFEHQSHVGMMGGCALAFISAILYASRISDNFDDEGVLITFVGTMVCVCVCVCVCIIVYSRVQVGILIVWRPGEGQQKCQHFGPCALALVCQ